MKAILHLNDGAVIRHTEKDVSFKEFVKKVFETKFCILEGELSIAINVNRIIWISEVIE